MEKSKDELLAGISKLSGLDPFPDEIFYQIFEIEDNVERTQYVEALRKEAGKLKRRPEFNNLYRAFVLDYSQRQKQTGKVTRFTDQPIELNCGEWEATDMGVKTVRYDKNAMPVAYYACSHPILPVEILKNVDTAQERISLAYFKSATWQKITVDRAVCANANKIVDALSQFGIEVTSDNAKSLVRYISDCVGLNPATLEPKKSINRLGWVGSSFTPYAQDIRYEGDMDYEVIFRNVAQKGDFGAWKTLCRDLRKNIPLRMMMAASFASVLLEPLKVLPFVLHLWGTTGTGKTVALMVAMSIWGNPKMGGLVKTMNMTKNAIMRNAAFLCSMSCMLLADEIAVKLFFPEERALQVSQVKQYLQSNFDVDVAERAYQQVLNWAAKNPVRFEDPKADNSPNKGEVWGKIDEDKLIVNRDVLLAFLDQNGFDYTAVSKKWSEKGYLVRNSQGKFIHSTKVYGIKSSYIKFRLPQDDDATDKDGFMLVEGNDQEPLPFD